MLVRLFFLVDRWMKAKHHRSIIRALLACPLEKKDIANPKTLHKIIRLRS
jgi:hypothetical protein